MSAAHTPGPWTLTTVPTSVGICHKVGPFPWKDGKQNHACIYADYPSKGAREEELLANARLIAAAPDLLSIAQQYASECAECNGTGALPSGEAGFIPACPDCADIRAAIARAGAAP